MDRHIAEPAITLLIKEIRERLEHSVSTARAAEACAHAGNCDQAAKILLDTEQPIYEASRLLDAASWINRLSQQD